MFRILRILPCKYTEKKNNHTFNKQRYSICDWTWLTAEAGEDSLPKPSKCSWGFFFGNRSRSLPFTLCAPLDSFGQQEKARSWCRTVYIFITGTNWGRTVITVSISVARRYFQDSHKLRPMQRASFAPYQFVCSEDMTRSWQVQSKVLSFLPPWQFNFHFLLRRHKYFHDLR